MVWPPVYLRRIVWSCDLADMNIQEVMAAGYLWVRPVRRPWAKTLRNPSVGRYLELLSHWDVGAVELTSREGRRYMNQLAVREGYIVV